VLIKLNNSKINSKIKMNPPNIKFSKERVSSNSVYKILTFSETRVGRKAFLKVALGDNFNYNHPMEIRLNCYIKELFVKSNKITLEFWTLTENETRSFLFENIDALIIFYDLTDLNSLNNKLISSIEKWYDNSKSDSQIPLLLIGTKYDLVSQINRTFEKLIEPLKKQYNLIGNIHTSSKTYHNIDESLLLLSKCLSQKSKDE
jgi:hypothetical protein